MEVCRRCEAPIIHWVVFPLCTECFELLSDFIEREALLTEDGKCPVSPKLRELMGLPPEEDKVWN